MRRRAFHWAQYKHRNYKCTACHTAVAHPRSWPAQAMAKQCHDHHGFCAILNVCTSYVVLLGTVMIRKLLHPFLISCLLSGNLNAAFEPWYLAISKDHYPICSSPAIMTSSGIGAVKTLFALASYYLYKRNPNPERIIPGALAIILTTMVVTHLAHLTSCALE